MESDEKSSVCHDDGSTYLERPEDVEDAWHREVERRTPEIDAGTAETVAWEAVLRDFAQ
jgi:hypothetical protein